MFELTPKFILIIQLIYKFYLNKHKSVTGSRKCFFFFYLFIGEYIIFQRLRDLLYHFVHRIPRSSSYHDTLANRKIREFIFLHLRQTIYPQCYQTACHQYNNLAVMHSPFYYITLLIIHITVQVLFLHILFADLLLLFHHQHSNLIQP